MVLRGLGGVAGIIWRIVLGLWWWFCYRECFFLIKWRNRLWIRCSWELEVRSWELGIEASLPNYRSPLAKVWSPLAKEWSPLAKVWSPLAKVWSPEAQVRSLEAQEWHFKPLLVFSPTNTQS